MNASTRSAKQYKAQRLGLQYAWTNPLWNGNILEKICLIASASGNKEINEKKTSWKLTKKEIKYEKCCVFC